MVGRRGAALLFTVAYLARQALQETGVPTAGKVTLVVLPFENLTGDPAQDYFSDGLTEEMMTQLGQLQPDRLGVIARTTAMQYKKTKKTAAEIGRELGVDYILEGSVRREGSRVRVSAQLIQAGDQSHLWAESYDREVREMLAIHGEVAHAIAERTRIRLSAQHQALLAPSHPIHPEGYEAYLLGRYWWNKRGPGTADQARNYFRKAIAIDPAYASAYAGLTETFIGSTLISDVEQHGVPAARKALALDDALAEAHTSYGILLMRMLDWPRAEKELQRAVALNPNDANARLWYGDYLRIQGRYPEAIAELQRARQLDPLSIVVDQALGTTYYYARQYGLAIPQLKETIEMDPSVPWGHLRLAQCYVGKRMYPEAEAAFLRARDLGPGWPSLRLAHLYAVVGREPEAREILSRVQKRGNPSPNWAYDKAAVHSALGESDRAFTLLRQLCATRNINALYVNGDPRFDPLTSDPRWAELLRCLKLADGHQAGN